MLRIKRIMFTIMASLGLLMPMAVPAMVHAEDVDISGGLKTGSCLDPSSADCDTSGAEDTIGTYIKTAINLFSVVVGIIAVVMIIIGGVKYITSGGDAGNVTGAKNTILYAIIGLVIVALSQVIVQFVLGSFSS